MDLWILLNIYLGCEFFQLALWVTARYGVLGLQLRLYIYGL